LASIPLIPFFIAVISIGISYTTIYLIASLGEIFSEKAGVLNLSLEGVMAMGAFLGYVFSFISGNPYFGLVGGLVAGLILGLLFAFISITIGVNQVLAGLSVWLVGMGLSDFIYTISFGRTSYLITVPKLPTVPVPYLSGIPIIGQMLFDHTLVDYAAYLSVPLLWYIMFRTNFGLKIISVGENPRAADSLGINVNRIRYIMVLFDSSMAGLSGSMISLTAGLYQVGMIAGRGWIAIGIAAFSGLNPAYGLLASLIFGVVSAFGPSLMIVGYRIPYEFLDMTPFIALLVVVMMISKRMLMPSALGKPYKREEK
jgi:simple sugar transport system permease protein